MEYEPFAELENTPPAPAATRGDLTLTAESAALESASTDRYCDAALTSVADTE